MIIATGDSAENQENQEVKLEKVLALYRIYADDNHVYNNIVWQFPTALIAANGLLIEKLAYQPPWALLLLAILNFGLIHAIFKLSKNQHAILRAMQRAEVYIKKDQFLSGYVPDFTETKKGVLAWSSTMLICRMLLGINILFFGLELARVLKFLP